MDACRHGSGCWRPLCPYAHSGRRAARWAAIWALLADQESGILEELKDNLGERIPERIVEQTVELAVSSGEAGSFGPRANDTTNAAITAVAKPVGEARPPGFVKYGIRTCKVFSEAGSYWVL